MFIYSSCLNLYLKKVAREKRIPFELNADPFYSRENINRLMKAMKDVENNISIKEHSLLEVEDD